MYSKVDINITFLNKKNFVESSFKPDNMLMAAGTFHGIDALSTLLVPVHYLINE